MSRSNPDNHRESQTCSEIGDGQERGVWGLDKESDGRASGVDRHRFEERVK